MRIRIYIIFLIPILISVCIGLMNCTTIPVKPISKNDASDLIGKWKGDRHGGSYILPVELEIFNENFEGRITFHGTSEGTVSYTFFGKIEEGKLVFSWGSNRWVKLNFHKSNGKLKLKGDYQWMQWGGTMSLRKVTK